MHNYAVIKKSKKKGFTLIEMMVAVSIFSIVVTISMGAIFTIVDANKKAQSLEAVMSNLNFSLEMMTRTIKTGQIITSTINSMTTKDQSANTIVYSFVPLSTNNGVTTNGYINRCINTNDCGSITAPEVNVTNLSFRDGTTINGGKQPSVVMIVQGAAKLSERVSSNFNIQTTITQRLPATN